MNESEEIGRVFEDEFRAGRGGGAVDEGVAACYGRRRAESEGRREGVGRGWRSGMEVVERGRGERSLEKERGVGGCSGMLEGEERRM
jgi:hypothetical protein